MLGFLMNRWVFGLITGLLMLGFAYWKGHINGSNSVQAKWDAEKVQLQQELLAEQEKARLKEQQMQAKIDSVIKERIRENRIVNTRYNALIDSLRDRPETRSEDGMPEGADVTVGCTGAGLARSDAEFLARYSADAAKLQAEYNSCRQAYEVIEKLTNHGTPKD